MPSFENRGGYYQNRYGFLGIDNVETGLDATLRVIQDWTGSECPLYLSTTKTEIKPSTNSTTAFEVSQADGTAILTINSTTPGLTLTGTVTGITTLGISGKLSLGLNGGAASASGLLMGTGTTANPATTAVADAKFVELRCESTATSGDNRLAYMRYALGGAGGGGECIRAFTKLEAAVGTARGAHISLDVATTGSVTGLGVGVDAQLLVPNQAIGGGTYGVVNAEIYSAGSSSSVTGSATAFFRAVAGGDTTGAATIDTSGYLMSIQGLTVASGKLFQANTAAAATHALRILIGGTPYYIMLTDTGA